jgi:hypothetical protein
MNTMTRTSGKAGTACYYAGHYGPISCFAGKAERLIRVFYNDNESASLRLCRECAERVTRDAVGRGYGVALAGIKL